MGKKSIRQRRKQQRVRRNTRRKKKTDQIILVETLDEYTDLEKSSLYIQQHEYDSIKINIARTVSFLNKDKCNNKGDSTNVSAGIMMKKDEKYCVRGLEHMVEEFVGNYGRNVKRNSKTAVFRFQ